MRLLFTATAGAREKVQAFLRDDGGRQAASRWETRYWSSAGGKAWYGDSRSDKDGVDMIKDDWYRGVITSGDGDGSYNITYDNSERVPHHCISLYLW